MSFKVYNGPGISIYTDCIFEKEVPPICRVRDCAEFMCVWLSDQWCFDHALEYVKTWDRMNQRVDN